MSDVVRHMCPACGNPPIDSCAVCLGTGLVTAEELSRYASVWNQGVRSGGVILNPATAAPKRTVPPPKTPGWPG